MPRYIKCSRLNGLVIDDTLQDAPGDLIFPNLFWVAVEPDAQGRGEWTRRQNGDVVSFSPLPSFAAGDANPVVTARPGCWQHQADLDQKLRDIAQQGQNDLMRARIAQWCQSQPEGSEAAFLALGQRQPASPRYRQYLNMLDQLQNARA